MTTIDKLNEIKCFDETAQNYFFSRESRYQCE